MFQQWIFKENKLTKLGRDKTWLLHGWLFNIISMLALQEVQVGSVKLLNGTAEHFTLIYLNYNVVITTLLQPFVKRNYFSLFSASTTRVAKTPSARQQCWLESFCKSRKFLRQVHYWLKNIRILCNTKYPDNMPSVRLNWKVSGQSKKCPDHLENISG